MVLMFHNNIAYVVYFCFAFIFQKREIFDDLASLLWHSVGTVPALLQVIFLH